MDRLTMIEMCIDIDRACMPENEMTEEKIQEFYKDISDEKLKKVYHEYYGNLYLNERSK